MISKKIETMHAMRLILDKANIPRHDHNEKPLSLSGRLAELVKRYRAILFVDKCKNKGCKDDRDAHVIKICSKCREELK